jgi:hypothetical protein
MSCDDRPDDEKRRAARLPQPSGKVSAMKARSALFGSYRSRLSGRTSGQSRILCHAGISFASFSRS